MVGLAARALALAGRGEVLSVPASVSLRNSEVIHAGIYYPSGTPGPLQCPGKVAVAYCAERGIGHLRCGS
jgi:L-2-hydroxyglutarate oxidase LhgO